MREEYASKNLKIQSKKHIVSLFEGAFRSHFHGKSVEFRDFREYYPDDDAKYIDWTVSSREGKTIMRRYAEEKQGNICCMIYMSERESLFLREKQQVFSEFISLVGRSTLLSGDKFGAYIYSGSDIKIIPAQNRQENILKIIASLDALQTVKQPEFEILMSPKTKKSILFCLTDTLDIDTQRYRMLSMKHDLIYVFISSYFENTLDAAGILTLRDTRDTITLNLDNEEKKQQYRKKRAKQIAECKKMLEKRDISFLSLDERSDMYIELLYLIEQRQGKR